MLRLHSARFAACLLPLALVACGDNASSDDPRTQPPLVRSASVELAHDTSRTYTGVVVARTQSDLGFRVQGKILERFVDTGQTVRRGQPLMRLDPADLKLQAVAQQQAVDAARARARTARKTPRAARWHRANKHPPEPGPGSAGQSAAGARKSLLMQPPSSFTRSRNCVR